MEKENTAAGLPASAVRTPATGKSRKSLGRRVSFARTTQIQVFDHMHEASAVALQSPAKGLDAGPAVMPEWSSRRRISTVFKINPSLSGYDLGGSMDVSPVVDSVGATAEATSEESNPEEPTLEDPTLEDPAPEDPADDEGSQGSLESRPSHTLSSMELASDTSSGAIHEINRGPSDSSDESIGPPADAEPQPPSPDAAVGSPESVDRFALDHSVVSAADMSIADTEAHFVDDDSQFDEQSIDMATATIDMEMTANLGEILVEAVSQPVLFGGLDRGVDIGVEADVELDVEPAVEPEVEPEVGPVVELEIEPALEPEVEPELQPKLQPESEMPQEPPQEPITSWVAFFQLCGVDAGPDREEKVRLLDETLNLARADHAVVAETTSELEKRSLELEKRLAELESDPGRSPATSVMLSEFELGTSDEKTALRNAIGITHVACVAEAQSALAELQTLALNRAAMQAQARADSIAEAAVSAADLCRDARDVTRALEAAKAASEATVKRLAAQDHAQAAAAERDRLALAEKAAALEREIAQVAADTADLQDASRALETRIDALKQPTLDAEKRLEDAQKALSEASDAAPVAGATAAALRTALCERALLAQLSGFVLVSAGSAARGPEVELVGKARVVLEAPPNSNGVPRAASVRLLLRAPAVHGDAAILNVISAALTGAPLWRIPLAVASAERLISDIFHVRLVQPWSVAVEPPSAPGKLILRISSLDPDGSPALVTLVAPERYPAAIAETSVTSDVTSAAENARAAAALDGASFVTICAALLAETTPKLGD